MDQYRIKVFWATENLSLCKAYTEGHIEMLTAHGFQHFKTNQTDWHFDPNVLVLVILKSNKVLGGMRVVAKSEDSLLPLEKVVFNLDEKVISFVQSIGHLNPMESCGLWHSKQVAGKNLSHVLSRLPIAIAPFINCRAILSFNATYTFRITRNLGYNMVLTLGDKGYFNYPTDAFRAAIWIQNDLIDLKKCSSDDLGKIKFIREKFGSRFSLIENNIKIEYEIKL